MSLYPIYLIFSSRISLVVMTMEDGTKILISQEMDVCSLPKPPSFGRNRRLRQDGLSDSLQFNEPPSPAPPRVAPSGAPKLKYPISKGSEPKGFSWFGRWTRPSRYFNRERLLACSLVDANTIFTHFRTGVRRYSLATLCTRDGVVL